MQEGHLHQRDIVLRIVDAQAAEPGHVEPAAVRIQGQAVHAHEGRERL